MRNQSTAGLERKSDAENNVSYMEMRHAGLPCEPDAVIHLGKGTGFASLESDFRSRYYKKKVFRRMKDSTISCRMK